MVDFNDAGLLRVVPLTRIYIPLGNHLKYICSYKAQEDIKHTIFIQVLNGV